MSEALKSHGETGGEVIDTSGEIDRLQQELHEKLRQAEASGEVTSIETLAAAAKEKAVSGAEHSQGEAPKDTSRTHYSAHGQLKSEAYAHTMRNVRSDLTPSQRSFSKIIHNPKVEAVSAVAAKTVARPSGILGGGLLALLGSTTVLYMASHYGFAYNFSVFIVLFVGGFILGLLVELLARVLRRNRA